MGAPARGTHATAMVNGNAVHALGLRGLVARLWPRPIAVRHAQRRDDRRTPLRSPTPRRCCAASTHLAESLTPPQTALPSGPQAAATTLTPGEAVTRFTECAEILRATTMSNEVVISCPVVGSTTLAVIAEVALMEATVHLLDLADAVGGVQASKTALAATRDLLVAVPDPSAAIESSPGGPIQRALCRRSGDGRHTTHSKLTATDGIKLALLT